jgi:hypothetical protein
LTKQKQISVQLIFLTDYFRFLFPALATTICSSQNQDVKAAGKVLLAPFSMLERAFNLSKKYLKILFTPPFTF